MSRGSQILLGIVFAFAAIVFVYFAMNEGGLSAGVMPVYFLGAFCGVVSVACLVRTGRAVTLRIIGAVICVVFVVFSIPRIGSGETKEIIQSIAGLVVFALPCGYLAITGKYPIWGEVGAVFGDKPDRKS